MMFKSRIRSRSAGALMVTLAASSLMMPVAQVWAQENANAAIAALIEKKDYDRALVLLNKEQAAGTATVETYLLLSEVYLATGAGIAAEAAIERARRLGADYAATVVPFAKALLVQAKYNDALTALRGANIPKAQQQDALIVTGDANFAEKRVDEAARAYKTVLAQYGPNFQAYLGLSRLALRVGDLDKARILADQAHGQAPGNTMVQYTRGLIARYQGDLATAENYFLDSLKLFPGNLLVNLELAAIRVNQGRMAEAETYLDAVYAASPKHPMALYLSGSILASQGRYEEADALLVRARVVVDRYLPAKYVRGLVAYQLGNYVVADAMLSEVLRARPANRSARLALAGTYLRQQRAPAAYDLLIPMLELAPDDGEVIAMAAAAAMAAGKVEEGHVLYTRLSAVSAKDNEQVLKGLPAKLALASYAEGDAAGAMEALAQVTLSGGAQELRDLGILGGMQLQAGDIEGAKITIATILKAVPDRALGYNMQGTLEYQQGQYREAIRSFSQALERNDVYYTALRNRGLALLKLEQYDAAEKDLKRLLGLAPDDSRAKAALGRALLLNGKASEAVEFFRAATQAMPRSADVHADFAAALAGAGNTTAAITAARETTILAADQPETLKRMGLLLLDMGQAELAARALSRYLAFNPDSGEAHVMHGRALLASGLFTGARASFIRAKTARLAAPDPRVLDWYVFASEARAQRVSSARQLLAGLDMGARPADISASVIGTFLLSAGDVDAAITAFKAAMQTEPTSQVAIGLARAEDRAGRPETAIRALQDYLTSYPGERGARMVLGEMLDQAGRPEDAAMEYETILRAGVADAHVIARLATAYLKTGNRASIALAERAYLILPEDPVILDTYGWVMLQGKRDTRRAVQALERATRRAPSNATYKFHLGMAYVSEGQRRMALQTFEQAVRLDQSFPDIEEAKRQISLLK